MISNPELIHYVCIARSNTIIAQHMNEQHPNMEALASECVAQTPPNHSLFSHTVSNHTYTFLIDPPFVFFAIFDHHLLKSQTLPFLNRIRSSFRQTLSSSQHHFAPLSFQPQFHSIFNDALQNHNNTVPPKTQPLLPQPQCLKKKKRLMEPNDSKDAAMLDVSEDAVSFPNSKPLPLDRQKAKHVWKKHVWVVLLLDLFVCAVLFVIWLWVCSGFKCIAY
ncbi:phytolongin Phyl2.2 [Abrus precatorius]|uniref:Phytolongin Phyl2.2 n=1 Tax=Abrus precatorius TaxID=3816 RepID=A0A8B8K5M1_ABRPR|nr:phytolongin Phyl2.2 [Abrus precatorius]